MRSEHVLAGPIAGLRRCPVVVRGGWIPGPVPRWRGAATSDESLVGVVFLKAGPSLFWCKSERPTPSSAVIDLAFFVMGTTDTRVQVNLSFQGGHQRWVVPLSRPPREIPVLREPAAWTGQPWCIVKVPSDPPITGYLLFILASEVSVGRNGLWRLRPVVAERVPEPFLELLTRGRTGEVEAGL